jgi:hypothetical protein
MTGAFAHLSHSSLLPTMLIGRFGDARPKRSRLQPGSQILKTMRFQPLTRAIAAPEGPLGGDTPPAPTSRSGHARPERSQVSPTGAWQSLKTWTFFLFTHLSHSSTRRPARGSPSRASRGLWRRPPRAGSCRSSARARSRAGCPGRRWWWPARCSPCS